MKYGYARVSSAIQLRGYSIADQIQELQKFGVSEENIVTEQRSAATIDRPKLQGLLSQLRSGDELVICKLDRLARSVEDGLKVVRMLTERGVDIRILNISAGQPFDRSPMGNLLFTILLAFAEFERSLLLERTAEGKAIARTRKGYREGRPPVSKAKIELALSLLQEHSTRKVSEMTGISRNTILKYKHLKEAEKLMK